MAAACDVSRVWLLCDVVGCVLCCAVGVHGVFVCGLDNPAHGIDWHSRRGRTEESPISGRCPVSECAQRAWEPL